MVEVNRDGARERAVAQRNKIMAARAAMREIGAPGADTLQEEQLQICTDLIALLNEPLPGLSTIATEEREALRAANMDLQKRLSALGALWGGGADLLNGWMPPEYQGKEYASFLLIVPSAKVEPDKVHAAVMANLGDYPTDPTNPRQLVVPRSVEIDPAAAMNVAPTAPAPATSAASPPPAPAGSPRQAEQDISIESWNPSNDDLAKLPGTHEQKLANLAAFKVANKGKTAKRWGTSFRSFHTGALARAGA